ncbi:MAG TPA: rhomboid family intramembrane serine protease [Microbacterium sp.]|uniref:rhomboid family intramembrane serine protease n=1 Tax=Microbacterium sp. TaxID=51671 RepID=UPI002B56C30A|nr:rhomboid family intramembrane serine protease [Microbacterium sp.]HWI32622.1 rhomboid family intramembrane serine protease [Microbacterium sp.]
MTSPEFARNTDNFCYRHPDRQSFVLCQRCLRTICPECQTQAAVGVICPECLRDQQKSQTPAQVKAERRWSRAPRTVALSKDQPVVTYGIIALSVLVYIAQLIPNSPVQQWLSFYAPWLYPSLSGTFEPWRPFTMLFVHGGVWHVGLNMLAVWMIGRSLEPLLGHIRYLALYLISGLGAAVAVTLLSFTTPVVGASGAVFGLLGALLVIGRHIGANISGILIIVGINLVIGFIPGMGISWQAHVGGLAVGALVGLIYARTRTRQRRGLQIALLIGLVVALVALLLIPLAIYA